MSDGDIISGLARCAADFSRGLYCPAELWGQVVRRLAGRDVESLLGSLPAESKEILRTAYRERPLSLRSESADDETHRKVERWCCLPDA